MLFGIFGDQLPEIPITLPTLPSPFDSCCSSDVSGFRKLWDGGPTIYWGSKLEYLMNFNSCCVDGDLGIVSRPTDDGWIYRCFFQNGRWVSLQPNHSIDLRAKI